MYNLDEHRMNMESWKYAQELKDRAEAAEARAAELLRRLEDAQAHVGKVEAERDAAQLELQQIRTILYDGTNGNANTALDMVKRLQEQCRVAQRAA